MNAVLAHRLPPGLTTGGLVLRVALFLLPCAALATALPERPHVLVVIAVVLCSLWWARTPDHLTGGLALAIVTLWWAVHGVVDWRLLVVGTLLLAAHVIATLLSYGPASLPVDRGLALLWLRRGLAALVPLPLTWVALRGLDADLAPPWLWMTAALGTGALLVLTARLLQAEGHEGLSSDLAQASPYRVSGPGES